MTLAITRRSAGDNYHATRQDKRGRLWIPDQIPIHVTEGNRASVRDWFGRDASDRSCHYMVCTDGTVDQFVAEDDVAFHVGNVLNPSAPLVLERPGVNPNLYSIGIEHEGTGRAELTPKQRAASVELIRDIARRWKIPLNRRHVVAHREIFSGKTCPGAIDVDRLVADAADLIDGAPRPLVVWSDFAGDWLIVVRIVSDLEWYFVPARQLAAGAVVRAKTRLSAMPLDRGGR